MTDDAMVPIARILGRGEALTVAAMLSAAGIIVHIGSEYYTSVIAHNIAVGGLRLTVPAWQYEDASRLLAEMLSEPAPQQNNYTTRAIGRFVLATGGAIGLFVLPHALLVGFKALLVVFYAPLMLVQLPVSVQGRSEYYLSAEPG